MKVAYLGPALSYTHQAAQTYFSATDEYLPYRSVDLQFTAVSIGQADVAVVPIENSHEGVVDHTLDQFVHSTLAIHAEIALNIHHALLAKADALASVTSVHAHPQALAQCRDWLAANLPQADAVPASSNADSAMKIGQGVLADNCAAIGSELLAAPHGLNVLARNIEDGANNMTRFLVIAPPELPLPASNTTSQIITSLIISADNQPGALFRLLKPLADYQVSMTRIESRPTKQTAWEYCFFIDIQGHADSANVKEALAVMQQEAAWVKILGSYHSAVL